MIRVLLADDNEMIRHSLKDIIFTHERWDISEAANGLEAVQMAATLKPDIVLLDFQMPVMNGLEAAKEIIKKDASIPIAMYTLHQNNHFEAAARAAGVRKVISKTDIFSSLVTCLKELLTG